MAEENKPEQPQEEAFDHGTLDDTVTEDVADYDAEETNKKEDAA